MSREIPLSKGYVAVVDDEDYERVVAAGKWCAAERSTTTYGMRSVSEGGRRRAVYLHTFLTGFALTDHINGDGLDNRKANLRPATHAENTRNSAPSGGASPYKGVFRTASGMWSAQITVDHQRLTLGTFASESEAATVYDAAARELHGEFARLNFPDVDPGPMRPLPIGYRDRTHCPAGHPYDADNTYIKPDNGARGCRACRNAASRRYTARKKAAA